MAQPSTMAQHHARPLRWTARHHRIVELLVLGFTNNEIAEKLNYSVGRISLLVNHPEIIAAAAVLRTETRQRSIGQLQDDLAQDARNTFDKLKLHRDDTDPDVSLKACNMLWDRQIPKRTESKQEATIRFVLESKDLAHLKQVAAEDDAPLEAHYRYNDEEDADGPLPSH